MTSTLFSSLDCLSDFSKHSTKAFSDDHHHYATLLVASSIFLHSSIVPQLLTKEEQRAYDLGISVNSYRIPTPVQALLAESNTLEWTQAIWVRAVDDADATNQIQIANKMCDSRYGAKQMRRMTLHRIDFHWLSYLQRNCGLLERLVIRSTASKGFEPISISFFTTLGSSLKILHLESLSLKLLGDVDYSVSYLRFTNLNKIFLQDVEMTDNTFRSFRGFKNSPLHYLAMIRLKVSDEPFNEVFAALSENLLELEIDGCKLIRNLEGIRFLKNLRSLNLRQLDGLPYGNERDPQARLNGMETWSSDEHNLMLLHKLILCNVRLPDKSLDFLRSVEALIDLEIDNCGSFSLSNQLLPHLPRFGETLLSLTLTGGNDQVINKVDSRLLCAAFLEMSALKTLRLTGFHFVEPPREEEGEKKAETGLLSPADLELFRKAATAESENNPLMNLTLLSYNADRDKAAPLSLSVARVFLPFMKRVKFLKMHPKYFFSSNESAENNISAFNEIKQLVSFPNLTEMVSSEYDAGIAALFESAPRLTHIEVHATNNDTLPISVQSRRFPGHQVKSLIVGTNSNLTQKGLQTIVASTPNITYLKIANNVPVAEKGIPYLCELTKLKTLQVEMFAIGSKTTRWLKKAMPQCRIICSGGQEEKSSTTEFVAARRDRNGDVVGEDNEGSGSDSD